MKQAKKRMLSLFLSCALAAGFVCGLGTDTAAEAKVKKSPAGTVVETVLKDGTRLSNDSTGFVVLSEAVPDAILEIRYYSTYNFVGDRIDG